MTLGKVPLKGLLIYVKNNASAYMHSFRKLPLRGLMYHQRKIAFERAADVCEKQCLQVGLTCIILDVTFKRAADVCMKQCL